MITFATAVEDGVIVLMPYDLCIKGIKAWDSFKTNNLGYIKV